MRAVYLYSAMADIAAFFKAPSICTRPSRSGATCSASARMSRAVSDQPAVPSRLAPTTHYRIARPTRKHARRLARSCGTIGCSSRPKNQSISTRSSRRSTNGLLSGVSVKGDTFFYQNPLEATGRADRDERKPYFDVACCPANLARLVAQLPGLVYATDGHQLYVTTYVSSEADVVIDGANVTSNRRRIIHGMRCAI